MRILVCGGRNYINDIKMKEVLDQYLLNIDVIIHGGARGADTLAGDWAFLMNVPTEIYYADWNKHGRSAGHIRNAQMLKDGKPDLIIAFPGGKGTEDMVRQALKTTVEVFRVKD
jgi:hypothetical protein